MSSAAWVFLAMCAYGALHSLLASHAAKAWAQRTLGAGAARTYRLFFNLQSVLLLLPVLALAWLLPDTPLYRIRAPWVYLTLGLQLLACAGLAAGVLQTGALRFLGLRTLLDGEETPAPFVAHGLYRHVRHPLYFFGLLLLWLLPVMSLNLLAFNLASSLYLWLGTLLEERKLLAEFGETYAAYRRRTPMLIPYRMFSKNRPPRPQAGDAHVRDRSGE